MDKDAIDDFRENIESNFPSETATAIDLIRADVTKLQPTERKVFDTVVLNPPFGTNDKNNGM